jgi:hypothetical protein
MFHEKDSDLCTPPALELTPAQTKRAELCTCFDTSRGRGWAMGSRLKWSNDRNIEAMKKEAKRLARLRSECTSIWYWAAIRAYNMPVCASIRCHYNYSARLYSWDILSCRI